MDKVWRNRNLFSNSSRTGYRVSCTEWCALFAHSFPRSPNSIYSHRVRFQQIERLAKIRVVNEIKRGVLAIDIELVANLGGRYGRILRGVEVQWSRLINEDSAGERV